MCPHTTKSVVNYVLAKTLRLRHSLPESPLALWKPVSTFDTGFQRALARLLAFDTGFQRAFGVFILLNQ
jgi:hypothetical protein